MSPERKNGSPIAVNREQVQGAVGDPIGTVVELKEYKHKPIKPSKISALKLAKYLNYQGFSLPKNPSYSVISSNLRKLPKEEQEGLLVGFYKESVKDFPNAEKVAKGLARVNNIDYFKPKEEPGPSLLQELVNQHLGGLNLSELPIKIIRDNWDEAQNTARNAAHYESSDTKWKVVQNVIKNVAQNTERYASWTAVQNASWDMARDAVLFDDTPREGVAAWYKAWYATEHVAWNATWYATWIVVEDIMPEKGYTEGNPFSSLIKIFEFGCWPIEIVGNKKEGRDEFVIFIPPIQKAAV
ncbi:MAG: hypothetical protein V1697_00850 [Candidatus Levyibacteriota bacterium]